MELEALGVFVDVMRKGSFAKVARERAVAPSSVSRAIAGLEAALGARLFQRTTRRLAPTDAAVAYFARVEPLVDELDQARQLAADAAREARGTLRITAPVSFAMANLVPLLPALARKHPALSFELILGDTIADLVAERIDVALRLGRLADSNLVAHRLCDMRYTVCASPGYLRRRGRPKRPEELAGHACLRYAVPGYGTRWRFRRGDEIVEQSVSGPVAASNGAALVECSLAGMGLVLLPRYNVAAGLASGALVSVLDDWEATGSDWGGAVWLLYPSRRYLPLKVRVFTEFMRESFRKGAPGERARS